MNKFEELKAEFEPLGGGSLGDKVEKLLASLRSLRRAASPCGLTATESGWSGNIERTMKAQAPHDNSMTSYVVSKKAAADKSDETVKDLIWLLFDTSLLTSGFNLDERAQFAGRLQHDQARTQHRR